MDNDNNTDGYFLNYNGLAGDEWRLSSGTGPMGPAFVVPGSSSDDREIDWIDLNNDGDVDVYISAFAGPDRVYRNQFIETTSVNLIDVTLGALGGAPPSTSPGADVGGMDDDGDPDIIVAQDSQVHEFLLKNNFNLPDVHAPRIANITQLAPAIPTSKPRPVHVRVYDNANQEYSWQRNHEFYS